MPYDTHGSTPPSDITPHRYKSAPGDNSFNGKKVISGVCFVRVVSTVLIGATPIPIVARVAYRRSPTVVGRLLSLVAYCRRSPTVVGRLL